MQKFSSHNFTLTLTPFPTGKIFEQKFEFEFNAKYTQRSLSWIIITDLAPKFPKTTTLIKSVNNKKVIS